MTTYQLMQNCLIVAVIFSIYAVVVRWRARLSFGEIAARAGLVLGAPHFYLWALAASVPMALVGILASRTTSTFEGSMLAPYLNQPASASLIGAALLYGFVATGFPEEVLFRGLIGGAFFRRFTFWRANVLQAAVFLLPHLLILLIAPKLWPLAVVLPFGLGLVCGWLRHVSGSAGPPAVVHAAGNIAGALAVLNWS